MSSHILSILLVVAYVHGTSAAAVVSSSGAPAPARPSADPLARATRMVDRTCPTLPRRLVELFGIVAEGAGVGLIALFESPYALVDYLVTGPKSTPATEHRYFASTESYAADVRLRYRALLEGIDTPACLHAVCEVERLKRTEGQALSAACTADGQ